MMKERSWNLQDMESIRNSMDPRAKEKHEEEHEDSKKERKSRKTIQFNGLLQAPFLLIGPKDLFKQLRENA
jgi:hypothetical protein